MPTTEPVVLRASESTKAGSMAPVMFMVPELLPPSSPILSVPAVTKKISDCFRERLPPTSLPRVTVVAFVRGAIVTMPSGLVATRPALALSSTASEITWI